jgi:Ras-related protein Rab-11A
MNKEDIVIEEINSKDVKEDYKLKLVVVGDSGVGKTNLIKRFANNTFNSNSKATVGVEFLSKSFKINNTVFKIEIWDTAGQERYKSITAAYYKGAKGALVVYDITSKISFENIDKWMLEIKEKSSKDLKLMIIGNKSDLKDGRQVSNEEAMRKAKDTGIALMETSALDSTNVKEAFHDLLKEMYIEISAKITQMEQTLNENKEALQIETNDKKKGCC